MTKVVNPLSGCYCGSISLCYLTPDIVDENTPDMSQGEMLTDEVMFESCVHVTLPSSSLSDSILEVTTTGDDQQKNNSRMPSNYVRPGHNVGH